MDFKQIQELIKLVNKTSISELKVEDGDFRITIRTNEFMHSKGKKETVQQIAVAPSPAAVPTATLAPEPLPTHPHAAVQPAKAQDSAAADDETENGKYVFFRSPMIGTFYRKPSPDKEPFVKVNDQIKTGDVICIIEAMKLFNEIEFEGEGRVVKILVEDSTPVEYDQPLFLIDPA